MAFDAFALILTMLGIGMLFARLRVLPDNAAEVLNRIVLYVCLPAAVLTYVPRLQMDASLLGIVATPWLLAVATVGLVTPWPAAGWGSAATNTRCCCCAWRWATAASSATRWCRLGEHALPYAVVYDQFGIFVLLSTFGLYVLAHYAGDAPPTLRTMLSRMLRFPPLWALLLGLTVMPAEPPGWIAGGLQRLADALLPLVMLAVGLTIQLKLPRDEVKPLAVGLVLRLLVLPALAWPLSLAFGLRAEMLQANVLESAMPSMITAAALAISHQLAPRLAAALVGYGILLSLVTLPAWAWVLQHWG